MKDLGATRKILGITIVRDGFRGTLRLSQAEYVKRCQMDHCCHVMYYDNPYIILLLYVDDMLISGANIEEINNLKMQMSEHFAMKDLGATRKILGITIVRDGFRGTLRLSQAEYVKSYWFIYVYYGLTRPDIAHAIRVVSRYMSNAGMEHWEPMKWIFRYLRGSSETCLYFSGKSMEVQEALTVEMWWKANVSRVIEEALQTGGAPNISDAYTINGQPGDQYACSKPNTFIANVLYGKTYLLRVINAAVTSELFFAIANHKLTVVGKDASYIKPYSSDFIMITPGQTMDILLVANATNGGRHYIAAHNYASAEGVPYDTTTTTAILQYNFGTPNITPSFPSTTLPNFTDNAAATRFVAGLRSLASIDHPVNVPQVMDQRLIITVAVNLLTCEPGRTCGGPNGDRFAASLNNLSFPLPTTDILEAYYYNISGVYGTGFPSEPPLNFNFTGENLPGYLLFPRRAREVRVVEYNTSLEIVFQGTSLLAAENHPLHLHGYSFYVVGRGFGNFDKNRDPLNYNLVDPSFENTVGVPRNGWAAIRFRALNPGVWFIHCHLDQHNSWGMDTVLIVKNGPGANQKLLPPPSYMPPC
ncbi:laccase-14-like [Phalaenopsis equestris]|uniref:laccase-14-like n=1 Tax=Phalaenopsis equestris TaxID=78828 RepID=UPI0009E21667|nr:laccase-14-like [Phalaenopsis equestris]